MVARFAETMFVGGGPYDFEVAVEQLTLLWANALGLREDAGRWETAVRPETAVRRPPPEPVQPEH